MNRRQRKRLSDISVSIVSLLVGLLIVFPVVYGILGAFKSEAEFASYPPTLLPKSFLYLENFRSVWAQVPMTRFFFNSLAVAILGTSVRLIFAVLAAYSFVFYEFRGKKFLFFFILGTMMLPGDTLLVTNYQTITKLRLLDTYLGMAIVSFVGATQMFMLRQNFKSSPVALREASQLDGCGDIRFLLSILLPISKPVLLTLFVQGFIALWNAYLWPLLVTNKNEMRTIQVGITMLTTVEDTNYYLVLAGVALSLIPAFILFFFLRRNITRSMTAGALVG